VDKMFDHTVPDSMVLTLHLITNCRVPLGVVSTKLHARSVLYIYILSLACLQHTENLRKSCQKCLLRNIMQHKWLFLESNCHWSILTLQNNTRMSIDYLKMSKNKVIQFLELELSIPFSTLHLSNLLVKRRSTNHATIWSWIQVYPDRNQMKSLWDWSHVWSMLIKLQIKIVY